MRSLVEVCAEQRAENWREWQAEKEVAELRRHNGRKNRLGKTKAPALGQCVDAARLRYRLRQEGRL